MTITTEEAERLAELLSVVYSLPVTAKALRSLAAERDAMQARVAELEKARAALEGKKDE